MFSLEILREFSLGKSMLVLCAVAAVASIDLLRRVKHRPTHSIFATILGTSLSIGLIRIADIFLQPGVQDNPYAMTIGILLIVLGWKALFGPWDPQTKAVMLGTFLFWIVLHHLQDETPDQRNVRLVAFVTALVPAVVWCMLFLKYHTQRLGAVLLLFFAGMLSTVPILFYDTLARRGVEMHFFLFTVTFENFSQMTRAFTEQTLGLTEGSSVLLVSSLLAFAIVGLIEEVSKYWVLTRSAKNMFSSIDDVMQLSIIVAIGFAFAENIINPVYFTAFVRDYLFHASAPDLPGFFSNVLGRSVLTSMVHIVSTGVMGYFLGLAIFAAPYLRERHAQGKTYLMLAAIHRVLRLNETSVFRVQMMMTGILSAIVLHGLFNFLVTLPDLLPGRPGTVGELFGSDIALLGNIPLLIVPSLFYVVGGFWLLTHLFLRKENMTERGHVVTREMIMVGE